MSLSLWSHWVMCWCYLWRWQRHCRWVCVTLLSCVVFNRTYPVNDWERPRFHGEKAWREPKLGDFQKWESRSREDNGWGWGNAVKNYKFKDLRHSLTGYSNDWMEGRGIDYEVLTTPSHSKRVPSLSARWLTHKQLSHKQWHSPVWCVLGCWGKIKA